MISSIYIARITLLCSIIRFFYPTTFFLCLPSQHQPYIVSISSLFFFFTLYVSFQITTHLLLQLPIYLQFKHSFPSHYLVHYFSVFLLFCIHFFSLHYSFPSLLNLHPLPPMPTRISLSPFLHFHFHYVLSFHSVHLVWIHSVLDVTLRKKIKNLQMNANNDVKYVLQKKKENIKIELSNVVPEVYCIPLSVHSSTGNTVLFLLTNVLSFLHSLLCPSLTSFLSSALMFTPSAHHFAFLMDTSVTPSIFTITYQ